MDKFSKSILIGILICLIVIAFKPSSNQPFPTTNPNVNISNGEEIIQLSSNKIAVVDNRNNSGLWGTILVFNYNPDKKEFEYESTMNYEDYFRNPQKYGLAPSK
jgi:hypothetical protein